MIYRDMILIGVAVALLSWSFYRLAVRSKRKGSVQAPTTIGQGKLVRLGHPVGQNPDKVITPVVTVEERTDA